MSKKPTTAFENTLLDLINKNEPIAWTSVKDSLGDKIVSKSLDGSENNSLKESIETLSSELEKYDREESPKKWAYAQYNLAINLHLLGLQDENGLEHLNNSVEAYKKVLSVWTRSEVPLDWATTMSKIGMVFQAQGVLLNDAHTLKISISAFNNVLTALTLEKVPLEWAIAYNNLGVSIFLLAEAQQDAALMKDSIESFENALQIVTSDNNPVGWLVAIANIALARSALSVLTSDITLAKKAVSNLESAVEFFADNGEEIYLELAREQKEKSEELLESIS